jgi:hypothetical protein
LVELRGARRALSVVIGNRDAAAAAEEVIRGRIGA